MKIGQRLGAAGITFGLLTAAYFPLAAENLPKTKFFKEPSLPLPAYLQAPPPSFEGKALIKNAYGNYVPVARPQPAVSGLELFPPAPAEVSLVDLYLQDGSETSIAINYDDGNNQVASYNTGWDFNPTDIPHSNSTNGNVSWTSRSFPNGAGTFTGYPYDPWSNAGNTAGEFFTTLIRNDASPTLNSHCVISRSTNDGANFSLFFERVKSVFQDREMVDIDKTGARGGGTGTTHDGKVYLCYDDFGPGQSGYVGSFLQVLSSAGTALTEIQVSGTGTPPFLGSQMQPVAGVTDGTVYLQSTAITINGATIFANFHEITAGGAGPNIFVKSSISWPATGQRLGTSTRWGLNGHRIDNHGYLDIDRSSGPRRGHLFFISNRNPNQGNPALDQGNVHLSVSINGAASWSTAAIPTAAGKTQYFPMLDVDNNGLIHVAYYQNETGATNGGVLNANSANLYYTFSTDGGTSWSFPVQVNTASSTLDMEDPPPNRSAVNYYMNGDYAQVQATGTGPATKAYVLWSGYDKDRSDAGGPPNKKDRVYCTTLLSCQYSKGDMDGNTILDASDVVALINCVFLGLGDCQNCFGDLDCNTILDASDVVLLINAVFLGDPLPC